MFNNLLICPVLGNTLWVCIIGHFNASDDCLNRNPLDHILIALPFAAREDAETMDEVFWGTEEEMERMCVQL
jgi:hypothetical protein